MWKYIKNNVSLFLKGMAIGTAVIIPGVSGGTIAFLLGIYDKMIEAITLIGRQFVKSFLYLLPILLGALVAVAALIFPIKWAFEYFPIPLITLFAGLIIGGLPSMRDKLSNSYTSVNVTFLLVAALVAFGLGALSVLTSFDASAVLANLTFGNAMLIILVGVLGASALVVPGISGSMLLLVIGFYMPLTTLLGDLMTALSNGTLFADLVPLAVVALFIIGLVTGFFLISWIMKTLLTKYQKTTYFAIMGFVLGSLVALYYNYEVVPAYGVTPWWHIPIALFLLTLGIFVSYLMAKLGRPHTETTR